MWQDMKDYIESQIWDVYKVHERCYDQVRTEAVILP